MVRFPAGMLPRDLFRTRGSFSHPLVDGLNMDGPRDAAVAGFGENLFFAVSVRRTRDTNRVSTSIQHLVFTPHDPEVALYKASTSDVPITVKGLHRNVSGTYGNHSLLSVYGVVGLVGCTFSVV